MIALVDMKWHLKVEHDDDDDLIRQYEASAVTFMQDMTGRYFGPPEVVTEYLSPNGKAVTLLLRNPALASDISASPAIAAPLVETRVDATTYEVVAAADYVVEGDQLTLLTGIPWTGGRRQVRVTYWRGYEPGAEPADVRVAVMQITAILYEHRLPVQELVGQPDIIPFEARDVLKKYRKVRV